MRSAARRRAFVLPSALSSAGGQGGEGLGMSPSNHPRFITSIYFSDIFFIIFTLLFMFEEERVEWGKEERIKVENELEIKGIKCTDLR